MSNDLVRTIQETLKETLKYVIYAMIIIVFVLPALGTAGFQIGKLFGVLSALMFAVTQIPGLIRRFELGGIFRDIYKILFTSRAQQGILMFLFGLTHYLTVYLIPKVSLGILPTPTGYSLAGLAVLTMGFLLAITSNTQSKRLLKKWWFRLHKLVFFMSWLIAIHILLIFPYQMNLYGHVDFAVGLLDLGIMILGALQIISLIYARIRKPNRPKPV